MEEQHTRPSPALPPEILAIIVSNLAVFDWSFAHLDLLNPWNPFITQSTQLEEQNRLNLKTKYALCLASKQLCAITTPLLYEFLWIRNPRSLFSLAGPIIQNDKPTDMTGRLERHTRRLDICVGGNADASHGPIYIASAVLMRICGKNLTHLSISMLMKDAASLVHDAAMCTGLNILTWNGLPLHSSVSVDMLKMHFNHLVVLDLTNLSTLPSESMLQNVIDFPYLHTLRFSICEMIEDFTRMVLPAIRSVDFEELPVRYDWDASSSAQEFVARHGFKLQCLILRTKMPRICLADVPELQYLAVHFEATAILDADVSLRSLERIGVLSSQPQVTGKHIVASIRSKVLARPSDFPALKTIETLQLTLPHYSERRICATFPPTME